MFLCIGVDVGGTNTDAVILKGNELLCSCKVPTTQDVTSGVAGAIKTALEKLPAEYQPDPSQHIGRVNIGTTHFVNAVVQRREIAPVAVLRLCGPASRAVPPFSDFPEDLKKVICGGYRFINGGYEYNGKHISDVDENEVRQAIIGIEQKGIRHVTIAGIFSLVCNKQEKEVAQTIRQVSPNISFTLSHEVGLLGLLERENAAILNESLKPLAHKTVKAFQEALVSLGLKCPFYLTQNDGTIISAKRALNFPVFTIASGPTNSMRGATFLCDVSDAIVIDIGGTTADVGVILNTGFPREASTRVKVDGVSTNFRMPDVLSIGLGGGSHVKHHENDKKVEVGPTSVGYRLTSDALIFGGDILTVSDIAVAGGLCDFGDKEKVKHLDKDLVQESLLKIRQMTEGAIDQVKIKDEPQPVILVGGGSIAIDEKQMLKGASKVIKPENYSVANAVGAALSKVSGTVDYVCSLAETPREEAEREAERRAREKAIEAGADSNTVEIVDKDVVTLSYLPGDQVRLHFTAVGDLAEQHLEAALLEGDFPTMECDLQEAIPKVEGTCADADTEDHSMIYKEPTIDQATGDWILNTFDISCIAIGAGILGCGGGGNPYIGKLVALRQLRAGKEIRVVHPDRLGTSPELTGLVLMAAFMGAPTIMIEKIPSATEVLTALKAIKGLLAAGQNVATRDAGKGVIVPADVKSLMDGDPKLPKEMSIAAVVSAEIGGSNSMEPLSVAADLGLPVVDADGMGRAFPELQMFAPFIYGEPPNLFGVADEKGNAEIAVSCDKAKSLEDYMRVVCVGQGCSSAVTTPLAAKVVQEKMVKFSLSRAWRLGCAVLKARHDKLDPVATILSHENGQLLITGKISDVSKRTEGGFAGGWVKIEGSNDHDGETVFLDFQNENLLAYTTKNARSDGERDKVLAVTPDLITVVDADTGEPITTEALRYGLRVAVLAMPCSPLMSSARALEIVGPAAFKYDAIEYKPLGNYQETLPVPRTRPQRS